MSVYIVAQLTIHDREQYALYEAGFVDIFNQYKGMVLSVDETPLVLEGKWSCTRTVLLEFPAESDAMAWYRSEAYQAIAEHRFAASKADIVLINGLP